MQKAPVPEISARKEKVQVARRRARVLEMYNRCSTQQEMAEALGVSQPTISRDIRALGRQASEKIGEIFEENLSLEAARLISGADAAIKRAWEIVDDKSLTAKERMMAISLLLKCYEARKEWLPSVYDAKTFEMQRKEMYDIMERELDAAMERRGMLDDEEKDDAPDSGG